MNEPLWNAADAARWLGISPDTLYRWIRDGTSDLPYLRIPGKGAIRFDPAELRLWLESNREAGPKTPVRAASVQTGQTTSRSGKRLTQVSRKNT